MPIKLTESVRQQVRDRLKLGEDRAEIGASLGLTRSQVAAIAAHMKMGTYSNCYSGPPEEEINSQPFVETSTRSSAAVLLGTDPLAATDVYWDPEPSSGQQNPHMLVLGASGSGKTYGITCVVAELSKLGIPTIIFDYGQGFSLEALPPEFLDAAKPIEILASRQGINLNPLSLFASDLLGPVNVAQRIADTFGRVYRIGVQQHSILRQAIIDIMADRGIVADDEKSWANNPPSFADLEGRLAEIARGTGPKARSAASVASHLSTVFVYDTFRDNGVRLSWDNLLRAGQVTIVQLKGLERSLESAVTELLLWNFIGHIESTGPSKLRGFIVLDEAHKLRIDHSSPVERILREGRKFGVGLLIASQQPKDFSEVAFANTATKLLFQLGANTLPVLKKMISSAGEGIPDSDFFQLSRGNAHVVVGRKVKRVQILDLALRQKRWGQVKQSAINDRSNDDLGNG
ncbi:MAG: ATP-binding protein [Candidatus Sumerlaeaceae bacterium]